MSQLPHPTVSVDRAVGHYVESLDIITRETAAYYAALQHPDKPLLEDCHIHFSGLAVVAGRHGLGKAVTLSDRTDAMRLDPQAPPADIVVFMGSHIAARELNPEKVSTSVKHELEHFARGFEPGKGRMLNDRELELHMMLALERGWIPRVFFAGKAALYGGALEGVTQLLGVPASWELAGGYGLGVATLTSLMNRGRKRNRILKYETELHEHYQDREIEKEAVAAAETDHAVVKVTPRKSKGRPSVLTRKRDRKRGNRVTDYTHRLLSKLPPQAEY
jgi:hypothetical protein